MNTTVVNQVRRGFYLDSVALMRLSAHLGTLPGIQEAVLMIGTPSNHGIMEDAGLLDEVGRGAGSNDLVIALRADDDASAEAAMTAASDALSKGVARDCTGETPRPRSIDGALDALADANLALISTPGEFAAREARAALSRDLNVMVFSDNVSLEDERDLKEEARRRGLLLMGPDCGTAYIAGTPLAFANRVPRGRVGVIAASGTGLQEFAVLVSRLGAGISQGIGVGGRDLSDAIGGLSTLTAIDLLAMDEQTDQIVLISKPPGTRTADAVFQRLAGCGKPVVACVFGMDPTRVPETLTSASTLKEAAERATGRSLDTGFDIQEHAASITRELSGQRRGIRGLFAGGTLCTEAQVVLHRAGLSVSSNAPVHGAGGDTAQHTILDLGADEYTIGRPHPMIEPEVRSQPLRDALADTSCAVVLLDVVLGHGSHENPARAVADIVRAADAERPCVIASVCGTEANPQDFTAQVRQLEDAGVVVAPSNADAAALAATVASL